MKKVIEEGRLRFTFGDSWMIVEKWDDSYCFKNGIQKLHGTYDDTETGSTVTEGSKAVDIVGVREDQLYLIEIKDYRGHAIATKKRQPEEIPLAIACKVRDTIAGLIGASKLDKAPWVGTCARLLGEPKPRIYVIAWIEDPPLRAPEPIAKRQAWQKVRGDKLKQHLAWLTAEVTVMSQIGRGLPDVEVKNLPGAGQS